MAEAPERLLFGHVFKYLHTVTEQAPNVARATDVGRCTVFRFAGLLVGMVVRMGPSHLSAWPRVALSIPLCLLWCMRCLALCPRPLRWRRWDFYLHR